MNKPDWIKDIDWKKDLKGELRDVADLVGIEGLIQLWHAFSKTSVYFSEEPLNRLRQRYVREYYTHGKAKEIARRLDTSETFVLKNKRTNKTKN